MNEVGDYAIATFVVNGMLVTFERLGGTVTALVDDHSEEQQDVLSVHALRDLIEFFQKAKEYFDE